VDKITVRAIKDAIRRGLEIAKDPANAEKALKTIKKKAIFETVKKLTLSCYD